LKPREFEVRVIPLYFEHAKFSSFIRQANGWGFRRVIQGRDRNSYYHEMFLRGLPHLCKNMKRPGISEKQVVDPEHEPDLYKISDMFPVPQKAEDESILLRCTLQGGPKARMPVYSGNLLSSSSSSSLLDLPSAQWVDQQITAMNQSQTMLSQMNDSTPMNFETENPQDNTLQMWQQAFMPTTPPAAAVAPTDNGNMNGFAPPQQQQQHAPFQQQQQQQQQQVTTASTTINNVAAAYQASSAASQFAAGFAAATALRHQQLHKMLEQAMAGAAVGSAGPVVVANHSNGAGQHPMGGGAQQQQQQQYQFPAHSSN
jgi:hypothetical protein